MTLQTLHPEKFDYGTILAQTPAPGLPIPKRGQCTYQELLDFITPVAAEILVQGIRDRVFDPSSLKGRQVVAQAAAGQTIPSQSLRPAPKITSDDRFLDWSLMPASEIALRDRVLGRLWFYITAADGESNGLRKRAVIHSVEEIHALPEDYHPRNVFLPAPASIGEPLRGVVFWRSESEPGAVVTLVKGGGMVLIREMTIDGERRRPAWQVLDPRNGNEYSMPWNNYSTDK